MFPCLTIRFPSLRIMEPDEPCRLMWPEDQIHVTCDLPESSTIKNRNAIFLQLLKTVSAKPSGQLCSRRNFPPVFSSCTRSKLLIISLRRAGGQSFIAACAADGRAENDTSLCFVYAFTSELLFEKLALVFVILLPVLLKWISSSSLSLSSTAMAVTTPMAVSTSSEFISGPKLNFLLLLLLMLLLLDFEACFLLVFIFAQYQR